MTRFRLSCLSWCSVCSVKYDASVCWTCYCARTVECLDDIGIRCLFSALTLVGGWQEGHPAHGRRKRGVCRGSVTPNYLCGGDIDMYIPLERIPSHANCMQHVLRCWERQSDGSEYKKTLRRLGLCRGPRWGSLQRSRKPPSWWGRAGCPLPKNPTACSRPFVPRLFYPPLQNYFRRRWSGMQKSRTNNPEL